MNLHLGINEIVWHSVRSFKFHLHILLISGVVLFVTHFGSALYRDNVGSFQCKYCFNEMIVYEIWKKKIYKKFKAMVKRSLEYEFGWSCDQRFFIFILLFVTYICFWKKKKFRIINITLHYAVFAIENVTSNTYPFVPF